ncbi:hypothetical protein LTR20_006989 [Exophiala xenobiotica]|nr:hypothetical protein LTR92_000780 [Exophiala xenobiotica]KAK5380568.1 hypothetical protein LTS13_003427 [Exophiala xenobiotica]KAK5392938.1 hypothetical protein LTR79_009841 [Exophiala xenobiotica]KAK5411993.1 hypothetical protein LTR90_007554 [Exophiala xenobiotica]KAK5447547.1 hypothetical protein LTR18_003128 [Exophiala xenobiotica]
MRALWSQIPRPRLNRYPSTTSIDTVTPTLVRKTTTAPLRRRPTFNDVFTIFLAPVLAAVFIVDTSWKAKQRKDWDDRLSAVQEEIKELNEREQRVRNALRIRSDHNGIFSQRRAYSTAAQAQVDFEEEVEDQVDVPLWEEEGGMPHIRRVVSQQYMQQYMQPIEDLEPANVYKDGMFSANEMANLQRFHRLNAIMLSIRMLLHLQIGPSPYFTLVPGEDVVDAEDVKFPQDNNKLVEMLRLTRKEIRPLRNRHDLFLVAPHIDAQASKSDLNNVVRRLTTDFDEGRIMLSELIHGFGQALLQTTDVLSISSYVMLLRSLSKNGNYSLSYHVIAAMKNSTLPLSDDAIFHILLQIGQACDSRSLNHILPLITRSDDKFNLRNKWERVHANGLDLPVPASLNVRLLQVLIYTALRCEQPERAEGWLSLLQEKDYGALRKNHLFRSFLTYYSLHGNWEKGRVWLHRSVEHASSIAAHTYDGFVRLVYRMLDLCVKCHKLPEYTTILEAAVKSGISPPIMQRNPNNRKVIYARGRSILDEWGSLPIPEDVKSLSPADKVRSFEEACRSFLDQISDAQYLAQESSQAGTNSDTVNMRHAVRRQSKRVPSESQHNQPNGVTLAEQAKINARFERQDNTIHALKASLEIAEARYKVAKADKQEQAETTLRLERTVAGLREQLDAALKSDQERAHTTAHLEKTAQELQTQLKASQVAMQELQDRNQSYAKLQAKLRNEIAELKATTKRLKEQQQAQPSEHATPRKLRQPARRAEPNVSAVDANNPAPVAVKHAPMSASKSMPLPEPSIRFTPTVTSQDVALQAQSPAALRLKHLSSNQGRQRFRLIAPNDNAVSPTVMVGP